MKKDVEYEIEQEPLILNKRREIIKLHRQAAVLLLPFKLYRTVNFISRSTEERIAAKSPNTTL